MGWHIDGEMGGVWTHPIKLVDGYWFGLDGTWLPPATHFISGMGYVQMEYPITEGLEIVRTEFIPESLPVILIGLTLSNPSQQTKEVELTMDVRSDILLTYPWDWSQPTSSFQFNEDDEGSYDEVAERMVFQEQGKPWYAVVGVSDQISKGEVSDKYWGPLNSREQRVNSRHGDGMGGRLSISVEIPGTAYKTIWFAVGGSHTSRDEVDEALTTALANPITLLSEKIYDRLLVYETSYIDIPDEKIQAAFDWSKQNLSDLSFRVNAVHIRDTNEGTEYPSPMIEFNNLKGIAAGFPDYYEFFGADGAYTTFALITSGMWETAMDHLRTIRDVSQVINGDSGKVVHEVMSDGSVYFGAVGQPGNTNETAQFAMAAEQLWLWSGDEAFRDEMYDFIRDGMHFVMTELDANGDNCPEGYGMIERREMADQKLDVSMYTWRALIALRNLAMSKGDQEIVQWSETMANSIQQNLENWWMPAEDLYADSIDDCLEPSGPMQQRHWISVTPLETGLVDADRAASILNTLESEDFTGESGLYHTGVGGGTDGKGELKTWTLPNSVMAVAEANYGRLDEDQALYYMHAIADNLDIEMPGALPEILPSPDYDPFTDMRDRAMFMQAWSSYGIHWPIINHFLGIRPEVPNDTLYVVPQLPPSWPELSVTNLRVGDGSIDVSVEAESNTYRIHVSDHPGLKLTMGYTLPFDADTVSVFLDGAETSYEIVDTIRGREIWIVTNSDVRHELVLTVSP
jgi:glycogen debranching enzyme